MLFLMLSLMIILIFYILSFLNMKNKNFINKTYPFECGFNPFSSPRTPFSLQFFKVLLIFLLFDMEIIIILPLPLYNNINFYSQILTMIIISLLILSLYFEWKEGSLNWMK